MLFFSKVFFLLFFICLNGYSQSVNEHTGEELRQLGIDQKNDGNYNEARTYYIQSLAKFELDQDSIGIANVKNNLGLLETHVGYYTESLEHFIVAERIYSKLNNYDGLGKVQLNMAGLFFRLKEYSASFEYYNKSLSSSQKTVNNSRIANIQMGMANILSIQDYKGYNLDKAAELYQSSLLIFENIRDSVNISKIYNNLARIYSQQNQLEKSLEAYQRFYDIIDRLSDKPLQILALSNMAKLHLKQGEYEKSLNKLHKAEKISNEISNASNYIHVLSLLVDVNLKIGNTDSASVYFLKYKELKDSLFNEEMFRQVNELKILYETSKKEAELKKEIEINEERKSLNRILIILIILLCMAIFLVFYYGYQKNKSDKMRSQNEKQIAILNAQINGEEKERKRIARDLHDKIGVLLTSGKMMHSKYSSKGGEMGTRVSEILTEASNAIREVSHNLSSSTLERFGLMKSIDQYFHMIEDSSSIKTKLITNAENLKFKPEVVKAIDYYVRELTNNTLKYGEADEISLQILYKDNFLYISYEDDGVGFDSEQVTYGLGFENIKSRVLSVNGTVLFESEPGEGFLCTVEISNPLISELPYINGQS